MMSSADMQRADQVADLLKGKPGVHCDDCIAKSLTPSANRHYIQSIANTLSKTREFRRTRGRCADCGREKLVTGAV